MAKVSDMPGYVFPRSKLKAKLDGGTGASVTLLIKSRASETSGPLSILALETDESRQPLVILGCGSYSPVTNLHLRMFEMAKDYVKDYLQQFEVIGGYFSPVGDGYGKKGLASGPHRVKMLELATEKSSWLTVDPWEANIIEYTKTAYVMDHFEEELNKNSPYKKPVKVMLLAGADLIESFGVPDLWAVDHLHHICGHYGCLIIDREGSDAHDFMMTSDILYQYRTNVFFIKQIVRNDISSTKVRLLIKRGMSIRYLTPDPVVDYIAENGLYR